MYHLITLQTDGTNNINKFKHKQNIELLTIYKKDKLIFMPVSTRLLTDHNSVFEIIKQIYLRSNKKHKILYDVGKLCHLSLSVMYLSV